ENSKLLVKYNQVVDRESAYEILNDKLKQAVQNTTTAATASQQAQKPEPSILEKVADNTIVRSMIRTAGTTIVRSLLGSLGLGGRSSTTVKKWL
ncbi:MAG: helicase HerA-like domain-containing protein, partial [Ginsengibacter sp.]